MLDWLRRRRFGRAVFFLPLFVVAPVALASFGGGPFCGMRPPHFETPEQALAMTEPVLDQLASKLDLSADQRAAVDVIVTDSVREMFDVRERGEQVREAMAKALQRGDAAEVEALRQQGLQLADEGSAVMLRRALEVREILTPAQRQAAQKLREDWRGR